jgi:Insertion element 4 transposase N-terminal/Transposase DDE domain
VGRTGQVNIEVLTQFVSPELVGRAIMGRTSDKSRRAGPLPMLFAVYFELALVLFAGNSYEDVAHDLVGSIPELREGVPVKSALLGARRRLGERAMRAVFEHVAAQPVAGSRTLGARWFGFRTFAVDGFSIEVPDTPANRACFDGPSASNGCNPARPVGYPQVKVVTLAETGTRAPRAAAIGGYRTGEIELAATLATAVGHGDLVLFDRGFASIAPWRAFDERGAAIVMREGERGAHGRRRACGRDVPGADVDQPAPRPGFR